MKRLPIFLILFSGASYAAEPIDMARIFVEFASANAAAGKCIRPKTKELESFLANYQMTKAMTVKMMKETNPEITEEKINSTLKSVAERTAKSIYAIVEKEGCNSREIQWLIKRFHLQAKWKPGSQNTTKRP